MVWPSGSSPPQLARWKAIHRRQASQVSELRSYRDQEARPPALLWIRSHCVARSKRASASEHSRGSLWRRSARYPGCSGCILIRWFRRPHCRCRGLFQRYPAVATRKALDPLRQRHLRPVEGRCLCRFRTTRCKLCVRLYWDAGRPVFCPTSDLMRQQRADTAAMFRFHSRVCSFLMHRDCAAVVVHVVAQPADSRAKQRSEYG